MAQGAVVSLTAPERETIITMNDEDEVAHIYTAQRPVITKLRKNPAAKLLSEGKSGSSVYAEFEIDAGLISIRSKRVKLDLSPEEREVRAQRLRAARNTVSTL